MTPLYQAPSVTGAEVSSSTGAALWQHLTTSFGYLNKEVSPSAVVLPSMQVVLLSPNMLMQGLWKVSSVASSATHICLSCDKDVINLWAMEWHAGLLPILNQLQNLCGGARGLRITLILQGRRGGVR